MTKVSRRDFLKLSGLVTAVAAVPSWLVGAGKTSVEAARNMVAITVTGLKPKDRVAIFTADLSETIMNELYTGKEDGSMTTEYVFDAPRGVIVRVRQNSYLPYETRAVITAQGGEITAVRLKDYIL